MCGVGSANEDPVPICIIGDPAYLLQGSIQAQLYSGWPLWASKKICPKMFFVPKINTSFPC